MQALILFISLTVGYGMRSHLSVTLVAMTGNATNCFEIELSHDDVIAGNFSNVFSHSENTDLCKESSRTWSVYQVNFPFQNINYQVLYYTNFFEHQLFNLQKGSSQ